MSKQRKWKPTPGGAIGYARYAFEFLEAAMLVHVEKGHSKDRPILGGLSTMPAYFLAAHGIELTLKAFIRHVDPSGEQAYGHDLSTLYKTALALGLAEVYRPSEMDEDLLLMLDGMNESQGLRYFEQGLKTQVRWSFIEPLMLRLHQAVSPHVGYLTFDTPRYPDDWVNQASASEGMTLEDLAKLIADAEDGDEDGDEDDLLPPPGERDLSRG